MNEENIENEKGDHNPIFYSFDYYSRQYREKLYFAHYKKLADERIEKVIELQGATLNNGKVAVDAYDSKNACWFKSIYFHDDPDITYDYEYTKSSNEVRVWAMYKNMSLDLANKKAKYPLMDVYFDKEGNIIKLEKR